MRRRRRVAAAAAIGCMVVALMFFGCTSTVRPPVGPLADAVAVLVGYDEMHRGLVLPRGEGRWVEYGFGEFGWYARMENAWYEVFATVLWPTRGTLGRREVDGADAAAVCRELPWLRFEEILVDRARADSLCSQLDARFERGRSELVRNDTYRMDFVPVDEGFWCLFNCNDAVAAWLEELGCEVSWVPIRTDLAVVRRVRGP